VAGKRSAALCYLFDVFPTVLELCGVAVPEAVEGKSLVPVLRGERVGVREVILGAYRDCQRMVLTERWKLIRYPKIDRVQLFDLESDPEEIVDLSAEPGQKERVRELLELLAAQQEQFGDR
jgi:arylsulfatase A-like enzyme